MRLILIYQSKSCDYQRRIGKTILRPMWALHSYFLPYWKTCWKSPRVVGLLIFLPKGLVLYPFMKLDFENLSGQKHYSPAKTYYQNKLALLMLSLYMRKYWKGIKIQAIRVTNVKVDMRRYDHLNAFMKNLYKIKSRFSISPEEMAKVYIALSTERWLWRIFVWREMQRS